MPVADTYPAEWKIWSVLTLAMVVASTAAIFIRLALEAAGASGLGFSMVLAVARLSVAALLLLPAWHSVRGKRIPRGALLFGVLAGLALALHFSTYITSLSYTSVTASITLTSSSPVWIGLLSYLFFRETLTRRTLLGTALALAGAALIGLGSGNGEGAGIAPRLGNTLAMLGALAGSAYFLLGREAQRRGLGVNHYASLAYATGALVLLPIPPLLGTRFTGHPPVAYLYMLLLALLPQLLGHTSFNWVMRWISPTLVTLVMLLIPVGSSVLAYLFFAEIPSSLVLVGAAVLLAGLALAITGRDATPSAATPPGRSDVKSENAKRTPAS